MKTLVRLALEPRDESFVLQLQDDGGAVTEYALTAEQLDELIELGDELLEDGDADEEDDGEIYQKPLG
jgi:hypothetical protein